MPSAETKRPKRHRSANIDTTEDLLDEWLTPKNNPVMQGLVSFLNVQPTQAASAPSGPLSPGDNISIIPYKQCELMTDVTSDIQTSSSGDTEAQEGTGGELDTGLSRKSGLSERDEADGSDDTLSPGDDVSERRTQLQFASLVSVSDDHLSSRATGIAVREQQLQVRSLTRAEDGHSANEQRTYLALWNAGNPVLGQPFRRNTIGHAGLARMLKVDKRQTKRWIPALIEKLTIEIEIESSYATKTTYRVFERDEIHARRLRAGYTSLIKNRGGVELLKSACQSPGDNDSLTPGATKSAYCGDHEPSLGGDNKYQTTLSSGDTVSPPYKEVNAKKVFEEHSSSELRVLMEQLHAIGIDADDEFGRQLIRRSRAGYPDITISEIVHFTQVKARYRGIQKSLTSFLLTAVPACFDGRVIPSI